MSSLRERVFFKVPFFCKANSCVSRKKSYQNVLPVFLHQALKTRHVTTVKSKTLIRVVGDTRLCPSLKSRMSG